MSIIFDTLSFRNFMSYGNKETTVNLNTDELALVLGINLDSGKEGYSRNGVGKTTIFQAIMYVLFDQGITTIKKDDFVNLTNKKGMVVTLTFRVDGSEYKLTRGRKPNKLELTKDGDPFTLHSAATVDDSIVQLLGMDSTIFLNTVLLSNNTDNFMNLKPAAQRAFMEKLLNVNILSDRADGVKLIGKDVATDLKLEEQKKGMIETQNQKLERNLETLKAKEEQWTKEREEGTEKYREEIKELNQIDVDHELDIIAEYEEYKGKLEDLEKRISALSTKTERFIDQEEKCKHEVESLKKGTCPFCEQAFRDEEKLTETKKKLKKIEMELQNLEEELLPLLDEEEEVKRVFNGIMEANPDMLSREECQQIIREINALNEKINSLKDDISNPYREQIEMLEADFEEYDPSDLYELRKTQDHCKMLVKMLTDSKSFIRKSVIDQYVPFLNQQINLYLEALELPHTLEFNSDLTMDISIMNTGISYGNLSNGEKLRVNLAVNLAFRQLVALSGYACSLLLLDEWLDQGGDQAFLHNALKLFKRMEGTSTFVISHHDEIMNDFERLIKVTKKQGFSNLEVH